MNQLWSWVRAAYCRRWHGTPLKERDMITGALQWRCGTCWRIQSVSTYAAGSWVSPHRSAIRVQQSRLARKRRRSVLRQLREKKRFLTFGERKTG